MTPPPSPFALCSQDSYLEDGFILNKRIGVGQPKRIENARILIANTAMDTDKIKIFGSRVRVDSMQKVADIEAQEKKKMSDKVAKIVKHGINCACTTRGASARPHPVSNPPPPPPSTLQALSTAS